MRQFLPVLIAISAVAPAARSETIVLRPDPCPPAAEQPLIVDLGDVEQFNADPERSLGRILVIYPPVREGWASARILMRFDLEPPARPEIRPACQDRPRLFQMPR